jgi:hypothetical protein
MSGLLICAEPDRHRRGCSFIPVQCIDGVTDGRTNGPAVRPSTTERGAGAAALGGEDGDLVDQVSISSDDVSRGTVCLRRRIRPRTAIRRWSRCRRRLGNVTDTP